MSRTMASRRPWSACHSATARLFEASSPTSPPSLHLQSARDVTQNVGAVGLPVLITAGLPTVAGRVAIPRMLARRPRRKLARGIMALRRCNPLLERLDLEAAHLFFFFFARFHVRISFLVMNLDVGLPTPQRCGAARG